MDPYRVFFPLGLAFAVGGSLLWIVSYYGSLAVWPSVLHVDWMMSGFMVAYVLGFLMTAIPRLTGTPTASLFEILLPALPLTIAGLVSLTFPEVRPVLFAGCFALCTIVPFALKRFKHRKNPVPSSFVFLAVGIGAGISGSALLFTGVFNEFTYSSPNIGAFLLYRMMVPAIVLGIGSQLIPYLFGTQMTLIPENSTSTRDFPRYATILLLYVLGGFIEIVLSPTLGRFTQAIAVGIIAIWRWQLYKLPKNRSAIAKTIWISCWLFTTGFFASAALIDQALHLLHLTYIGGLGLMAVAVSTRVVLSHGGWNVELGENSKIFYVIAFLFVVAAFTRATATYLPLQYSSHLAYASILFVIGVVLWTWKHLAKMLFLKSKPNH